MTRKIRFLVPGGFFLAALTACNVHEARDALAEDSGKDNVHEKSFSWEAQGGEAAVTAALAKARVKETRFQTREELDEAVRLVEDQLNVSAFSDSLWKPIDYACDELALALWNTHGTIFLRDSVVLDERTLKADCRYLGADSILPAVPSGLAKGSATYPTAVEEDRRYPYKMIGESWDDFDLGVYKSTGGETQFKKHREKFGFTGWYDTDAARIGVRIYLLNCSLSGPRTCYVSGSKSDAYGNDDYVSKRDAALGLKIKMTRPGPQNNWTPTPKGAGLIDYKVSDAVISLHSADHAGMQFRATSSSGLTSATEVIGPLAYDYVTW